MTVVIQRNGVNGVHKSALPLVQKSSGDHDLVLKTFRLLIADLCQQFNGGHPGYAHYK
jgi:dihydroxyacetone synthase